MIKLLKSKSGDSIASVIAAVAILLIVATAFSKIISFSNKMIINAEDIQSKANDFFDSYYAGDVAQHNVGGHITLIYKTTAVSTDIGMVSAQNDDESIKIYSFGEYQPVTE